MMSTANPNDSATPNRPIAPALVAPAMAAAPHPMRTRTIVPMASARYFFMLLGKRVKNAEEYVDGIFICFCEYEIREILQDEDSG